MSIKVTKIAMILAAVCIAVIAGSFAEINDIPHNEGGVITERSHSLLFEKTSVTYPAVVNVSPITGNITIGFDVTPGQLDFGTVPPGGSISRKFVEIANPTGKSARITLKKDGRISPILYFSENNFILTSGRSMNVTVYVAPFSGDSGIYEGNVEIEYKRMNFEFLEFLL